MRKMKNSGVDWIGQIPSDWDTKKCKYITTFINGSPFESERLKSEYLYPVIRISDIQDGSISLDDCLGIDSNYGLASYLIKNGDILLAMSGATVGKVGIVKGDVSAYINQRVGIIRTGCPSFLFYCLSTKNFIEYVMLMSAGTAQPNISTKGFGEYPVPFPPLAEQQRIADFLDEKCSEIDSIRSDIQKQIDILNDYKKSVITEAVIKGLNPKAKLKDSGIEWIGKIPEGWMIKRLGTLASSKPYSMVDGPFGSDMKNEEYVDEGIPIIQLTNIKPYYHNIETLKFITEEKHKQLIRHTAEAGDIAIAKMMPAGRACILSNKYHKYVVAADAIRFKVNESNDNRFILYGLNTYCMTECEIVSKGSTRIRISLEIARKLNLAVPPLSEQKAITDYLDEKCSEIDATIADKQKQLETLDEYKKSLIFEYVTGKKECV